MWRWAAAWLGALAAAIGVAWVMVELALGGIRPF
jgi:hypothetical protein